MRRAAKAMLAGAGLTLSAALVLLAHGALMHAGASCPIGQSTAIELEAQRQRAMGPLTAAASRTAPLRDTLLAVSRAHFIAVEETARGRCAVDPASTSVRCESEHGEVLARFDPADQLVALDRVRYGLSAEDGERVLTRMLADARLRLGDPTRLWGEPTASYLGGPLRQAGYEYRFTDVAIDVTVTHLGRDGLVLREQHRAVPRAAKGS
ncbi:MAG: hypothetical protein NVS3B10_22250 [Polyangiales bacterium]